jgi:hypothetical protein
LLPLGEISICTAGRTTEAKKATTTTRNKMNATGILLSENAAEAASASSMVNEYSYWIISSGCRIYTTEQEKRPLLPAARVSEGLPLEGGDTAGRKAAHFYNVSIPCNASTLLVGMCARAIHGPKEKGSLSPKALSWEVKPSRGNNTIGRNDRVLPEMVKPSDVCHPSGGCLEHRVEPI